VNVYETRSEEETIELGRRIAASFRAAPCAADRNLGAGKTTIAKESSAGSGRCAEEVTSPTFTLIHEYGGGRVYTSILYRWIAPNKWRRLAWRRSSSATAVVLIEWGERFPAHAAGRIDIRLRALEETAGDRRQF